jgi:allophanate hydrolase subunit 1
VSCPPDGPVRPGPHLSVIGYGASALLVQAADLGGARAAYAAIRHAVDAGELTRPGDIVPGARTVLVDDVVDLEAWRQALLALEPATGTAAQDAAVGRSSAGPAREVVVETRYDGADLGVVARAWECPVEEVVRRHQEATFTVAFCGFAPGFAYCVSDPALPVVPRRDSPRDTVPAGSVALAGEYCGIYPRDMPGGWQLIGSTDLDLFDQERDEPATLRPGDAVCFREIR